tara:strand:+ start:101 stop:1450 length:1350 start_codon:yes stop_codon:yes gene_type:complete
MKKVIQLLLCLLLFSCGSSSEPSSTDLENVNPSLSSNRTSLSFDDTMVSLKSESRLITLTLSNLNSDILIEVSDGFEVSNDNTSFFSSLSITPSTNVNLYVRFSPNDTGNNFGNLIISSAEIDNDISVSLYGNGLLMVHNYLTFDDQPLGFGGGFNQSASGIFNLHEDVSNIERVKMFLQIDCPNGNSGCDDWDRFANIKVKDNSSGSWYEIGRYITPYWTGTQVLERGLEFDVTDFKFLLTGVTELRIYIENWTTKPDIISIDFDYVFGTPDYQNYEVSEVLGLHSNSINCVPYGVTHNVDLEKSILIPAEAESTHLRTIITGWGHATPTDPDGRPCAEWCYRTHQIKINNSPIFQHYMGPIGCPSNPINDEQEPGSWEPNRAGWCPGMAVPVRTDNIDPSLNGSPFIFEYDFQDWTSNGVGGNAFYAISSYIVVKSNSEINPPVIQD